jgi:hypothetical protein
MADRLVGRERVRGWSAARTKRGARRLVTGRVTVQYYSTVASDTAAARSPWRQLGVLGAREIGADPRLPRLQEIGTRDQERLAVLGEACLDVS